MKTVHPLDFYIKAKVCLGKAKVLFKKKLFSPNNMNGSNLQLNFHLNLLI